MAVSPVDGTFINFYDSFTSGERTSIRPRITLQCLPQQNGIRAPDDDWTGVSDPVQRRRVQNRLHQRAWRKRRAAQRASNHLGSSPVSESDEIAIRGPSRSPTAGSDSASRSSTGSPPYLEKTVSVLINEKYLWQMFNAAAGLTQLHGTDLGQISSICHLTGNEIDYLIAQFQSWVNSRILLGGPATDALPTFVKINVFRALTTNAAALGFDPEEGQDDDAISPFCKLSAPSTSGILKLPSALRPTEMQRRVPHHPWIDKLPFAAVRDNLIRAGDTYDDMELCGDLVGLFSAGTGRTGMIVWGEPWDVNGWEVTEQFLEYWGWTVQGSWDLFESTNRWRVKRGEKPLCFDNFAIRK